MGERLTECGAHTVHVHFVFYEPRCARTPRMRVYRAIFPTRGFYSNTFLFVRLDGEPVILSQFARDNHSNRRFRENYEFKLVFDRVWNVYGVFVGVFPFKYSSVDVTTIISSDDILFAKCFLLWISRFDSDLNLNVMNRVIYCGIMSDGRELLSRGGEIDFDESSSKRCSFIL